MTQEQLKAEMLKGLNNTVAEEVVLDVSQVQALLGPEVTEKLALFVAGVETPRTVKRNSILSPEKKVVKSGMAKFMRVELLAALTESKKSVPSNSGKHQPASPSTPGA